MSEVKVAVTINMGLALCVQGAEKPLTVRIEA